MTFKSFLPAILWFVISFILLALPGDDLPRSHFFDIPFFDKYVHWGMFFLLTFLFSFPFVKTTFSFQSSIATFFKIAIYVILYGVAMEFFQKYCVRGRSFDVMDILADSVGSGSGLLGIRQYYMQKIGPDRNRGRNQN